MKKTIAVAVALLLTLTGCGKNATQTVLDAKISAVEADVYRVEACDGSGKTLEIPVELYRNITDDPSNRIAEVGVGDTLRITFQGKTITAIQAQTVHGVAVQLEPMIMIDGAVYLYTGEESTGEGKAEGEITAQVSQTQEPTENGQSNFGTGFGYRYGEEGTIEVCVEDTWWVFETKEHRASREDAVAEAEENAGQLLNDLDTLTSEVMGKSKEQVHELLGAPTGVRSDPEVAEQYDVYLVPKESGDTEVLIGYDDTGSVDIVTKG